MIEQGVVLLVQGDAAVQAVAPTGGYFAQLPKDYALPSWTYTTVSDVTDYVLEGPVALGSRRIQIDCYGVSAADVIRLAKAIDAVLSGYHGTLSDPDTTVVQGCFHDSTRDAFDPDSQTFRRSVDYMVWFVQQPSPPTLIPHPFSPKERSPMPKTKATIGYLATFSVGDSASPIAFTPLAEIKTIKPNIATIPAIDATHLQSPNATEEKLPGLIKPGTVDITGNFIGDASQLQILTLAEARTVFPFKITAPINSGTQTYTITGTGFISKYDSGPFEASKVSEFSMSMEITGTVTETVA